MSSTKINYKLEQAFKIVLTAQQTAIAANFTAHDASTLPNTRDPYTISKAIGGPEFPRDTGNRKVKIDVSVYGTTFNNTDADPHDDAAANHAERVAAVFDVIKDDNFKSLLSAAVDDFYAYDVKEIDTPDHTVEEEKFKDTMTFEVYCCPCDVT